MLQRLDERIAVTKYQGDSTVAIPIGRVLQQAGLVSLEQIKAARSDQEQSWRPLGEILAETGVIQKQTVDFFVNDWPKIQSGVKRAKLEQCLLDAGLITPEQWEDSVKEKQQSGLGIESIFILKGWVNETTINFFREHLAAASLLANQIADASLQEEVKESLNPVIRARETAVNPHVGAQQGGRSTEDGASLLKILKSDVTEVPKIIRSLLATEEEPPKGKNK
ncbi:MAG: hypothetical protein HC921_01880 [Synechococcaceae cyanobacterium SM2_3_1]|nr:hypothetical protein [Synechococcaceae cyanobacterium SM2_3_1]